MTVLQAHRANFLALEEYIASATFMAGSAWRREGIADILVHQKSGDIKTCVIVGEVLDDRLFCGPNGNFTAKGKFGRPFEESRFSLFLGKPQNSPFEGDFDISHTRAIEVEDKVSLTADHRYWRENMGALKAFKFSCPMFEERVSQYVMHARFGQLNGGDQEIPLKPEDVAGLGGMDKEQVDDIMTWPATNEAVKELSRLKLTHRVMPLPVYDIDHNFVEPARVNALLKNSIVELHFNVKHYAIRTDGLAKFDTYTAVIRQIIILRAAPPRAADPYRRSLRAGPVRLGGAPEQGSGPGQPAAAETRSSSVSSTTGSAVAAIHEGIGATVGDASGCENTAHELNGEPRARPTNAVGVVLNENSVLGPSSSGNSEGGPVAIGGAAQEDRELALMLNGKRGASGAVVERPNKRGRGGRNVEAAAM